MTSKRLILAVVGCIVAILAIWLVRYFSAEQVIRRQILAAVESFESEKILGVATTISREYWDDWGMTYETVLGHVQEVMSTFSDLAVDLDEPLVEVDGDSARVRLRLVISGTAEGTRGYVLGSVADPVTTTQLWRKEPAGWRVISTESLDIPELREELDAMRRGR